ncbi:MAG: glutamine synthetase [Candidatus Omnitrophota bacterium]|jgi:glutamine synthetase
MTYQGSTTMNGKEARVAAISTINNNGNQNEPMNFVSTPINEIFGTNVFSPRIMKQRLPKSVYKSVMLSIETGSQLDWAVADIIAAAMRDWAVEKGATHYAHVFHPLTGSTAEKHDGFLAPDGDGGAILEFSGKTLIQGEPDASSFPNGGIRSTFEARGYTAWDVTSAPYILDGKNGATLSIPTAFMSWTGEALDKKTPVLRSGQALSQQVKRMLKIFGHSNISRVVSYAGAEQEYFLVDRNFYNSRPDLITAGRTVMGASSTKGQEFSDHYFGSIPGRVLDYMQDCERELYKLGIPAKTRHNEVSPGQYEIAPIFEDGNVATDHQQLTMYILQSVAVKHGMACLFHEKPFKGVNGSGKHLNWSVGNSTQGNLLDPGDTPHDNAQFLVFCAAVIRAVHKYASVLRAAIASASNDHRLGANEAPPAILSIFLGEQLTDVFEQIKKGGAKSSKRKGALTVGVDTLPPLPRDAGDRNRTSPFAFTGNRFEFRAVGSKQSVSGPLVVLNTIMAESIDYMATRLEKDTKGDSKKLNGAIQKLLKEIITEHGAIIFNGDGYSEAWHKEAEKRGLPNLRTAPEALPAMLAPAVTSTFAKYKVLSKREMQSRVEIYLEQYVMTLNVECNLVKRMTKTMIIPAAVRYQNELIDAAQGLTDLNIEPNIAILEEVTELLNELQSSLAELEDAKDKTGFKSIKEEAAYNCKAVLPLMDKVRSYADLLEELIPDDLWPLPTYQEMLFIK